VRAVAHADCLAAVRPRSWVKILKELELVACVNGLAVHDVNLQLSLYKSYASGLWSKYFVTFIDG
jgi:hypothetical protein